jgi:glutamine amidotransferase-like uncharacterized protein
MKRRDIIIYDDPRAQTSISCLPETLRETFPGQPVRVYNNDNFIAALEKDKAAIAVMPGIWSETSRYYDLLGGEEGQRRLGRFVENGGILIAICAAAYLISRHTEYTPPWGPAKAQFNPAPLFNAVARGPLQGLGEAPGGREWYENVHAAPVAFKMADGPWQETCLAYGNGPALYPDSGHERGHEVLARYSSIPGRPAAAAWRNMGHGAILWLGILPHIGWQPVNDHASLKKVRKLMDELEPHEDARRAFWNLLAARIKNHRGNHPDAGTAPIEPRLV